jgi:hypothetical protein
MSILPGEGNTNSWTGWIPTVSGQLSFSIIGHSSAAANCTYVNDLLPERRNEDTAARFIALHQFRTAPDYPYPNWVTRRLFPGAAYDFFMVAETYEAAVQVNLPRNADGEPRVGSIANAQGVLSGKVYVLLHDKDKGQRAHNQAFILKLKETMWRSDRNNFVATKDEIARILGEGREARIPMLSVEFSLFRTGEFRIWIEPGSTCEEIFGHLFETAVSILPNQVFYFVKDVVHRHYHHDGSSDQMLSLTRGSSDYAKNEIDWRRHTLWGLVRVVMQYRRTGRWPDLQKARGVAAYAEAFQHSFGNCLRNVVGTPAFEPTSDLNAYDFKHIRESIDVSAAERAAKRSATWQALTLGVTVVLAVLIAWSSYGSKVLALRLAACGENGTPDQSYGLHDRLNCSEIAADAITEWEALAHSHPGILILVLLTGLALTYNPVLRDIPVAEGRIGRRWQAIQATLLLFVYASHTTLIWTGSRIGRWVKWLAGQIPHVMLFGVIWLELRWLVELLQSL